MANLQKMTCSECKMFCGFIRDGVPPMPNTCPIGKGDCCQTQLALIMYHYHAGRKDRDTVMSKGK